MSKEQGDNADLLRSGLERGMYMPSIGRNSNQNSNSHTNKIVNSPGVSEEREIAGFWGYLFQIIYQVSRLGNICMKLSTFTIEFIFIF